MKILEKGYYELKWGDESKWMHFSRTSLSQLNKLTGKNIAEFGDALQSETDMDTQFDLVTDLVHSGFLAHDLEEGIEIDYNTYKVGNWLWLAIQENADIMKDIMKALESSLPKVGKGKGQEVAQ